MDSRSERVRRSKDLSGVDSLEMVKPPRSRPPDLPRRLAAAADLRGNADGEASLEELAEMQGAPQCHSIKGKGRDESCQATSDASGGLWVVVDGSLSEGGGSYFLQAN